ncbi:CoA-binding protein [Petroclostridium xylanilyticum]|uniref:CoA-binding protein n=1 Tax=Petroclostridium xylanilyticum TaxID=1792311 RepID=UPI000B982BB1|nr:CoA-binding protein [Petroclostridium xylanilyticum]
MREEELLKMKTWAVVGATENQEKYGYKIYQKLKSRGYKVYPVNPNYSEVEGDKCYSNLSELPEVPDVIDMVVAPRHGIKVVEEAARLGIKNIWLQPGTVNDELLKLAEEKGINTVQACVLVALNYV